jgi:hypothetical protein
MANLPELAFMLAVLSLGMSGMSIAFALTAIRELQRPR